MVFRTHLADYVALVMRGQDEAAAFLRHGNSLTARAITLCPHGAHITDNVCAAQL